MSTELDQLVHSFAETIDALDGALRARLDESFDAGNPWAKHLRRVSEEESLYSLYLGRQRKGDLPCEETADLLGITIREFVFLQNQLYNLSSSLSRQNPNSIRKRPVVVGQMLNELGDLFFAKASQKGIEMRISVREDLIVHADAGLARRALINVLDNAVKYSYSSTSETRRYIDVEARRHSTAGDVMLSVTSYGVGIMEDEIASGAIFRYGFRGALASDRRRSGTGIGLAETKSIVERHGGSLRVSSAALNADAYKTVVILIFPGS